MNLPRGIEGICLIATIAVYPCDGQTQKVLTKPNDVQIREQVQQALTGRAFRGSSIDYLVKEGSIELSGNVRSEAEKELASQDIADVRGVKKILNNLTIVDSVSRPPASTSSVAPTAVDGTLVPTDGSIVEKYFLEHWFSMASGISAILALFFSAWSFKRSSSGAKLARRRADIASQYSEFTEFNRLRLEFPRQSHLMEIPKHYREVCEAIRSACDQETAAARTELKIQERAVAILIFSMYERILFDLQTFEEKDQGDTTFLRAVLGYLHSHWLRNPRLLYWWPESGGSLCSLFEPTTLENYEREIAAFIKTEDLDSLGPFEII